MHASLIQLGKQNLQFTITKIKKTFKKKYDFDYVFTNLEYKIAANCGEI
jgi:hypothetical protein